MESLLVFSSQSLSYFIAVNFTATSTGIIQIVLFVGIFPDLRDHAPTIPVNHLVSLTLAPIAFHESRVKHTPNLRLHSYSYLLALAPQSSEDIIAAPEELLLC